MDGVDLDLDLDKVISLRPIIISDFDSHLLFTPLIIYILI